MRLSYKWLNEYVKVDDIDPITLQEKLTSSGNEVEGVESYNIDKLYIGQVVSFEKHPDSDHLNICMVDYGDGLKQIVCGANNFKVNDKVIVATPGCKLEVGIIEVSSIKGVVSYGMLCSLNELGVDKKYLSEEEINGIKILGDDAIIGEDPIKYLGLDDTVFDVSITPNRIDCTTMWGMSKEVGAILNRKASIPYIKDYSKIGSDSSFSLDVKTAKCPVFLLKVVNDLKIGSSPKWMRERLMAAGVKSVNNIVDISNYVMLETGQPLHFYDLKKFDKKNISVVDDFEGKIQLLDGIEYDVLKGDILICSDDKPIGLAGIMGGEESKIEDDTNSIVIEAALFNNVSIRNSANRLGLNTEASSRFSKTLEPLSQIKAVDRACELLVELCDAKSFEKTIEYGLKEYENIVVKESLEHCNKYLGTDFSEKEVYDVLNALDLNVEVKDSTFICHIPSYRTDLKIREDLDEEIIRLIGYDRLKTTLPMMTTTFGSLNKEQKLERKTRNIFKSYNLDEIVTYSLVKKEYVDNGLMKKYEPVELASPLSDDRRYVRNSLFYSLLETASYNLNRKNSNVNLYEISNVYEKDSVNKRLAILLNGNLQSSKLYNVKIKNDFYVMKGMIESYIDLLGIDETRVLYKENDDLHFHPYRSAKVYIDNKLFGIFGELHPEVLKVFDFKDIIYGEFDLDLINDLSKDILHYEPLDKYPSVSRDLAVVLNKDVKAKYIIDSINSIGQSLIRLVEIFDIYYGENIGEDKKSIAFNIKFQSSERTLKDQEINEIIDKIVQTIKDKFNGELRN